MFEAFRKYQRVLFFIVAAFVFSSFIFFGTFNSYASFDRAPSIPIGKLVSGDTLQSRDLDSMKRFLSGDWQEENGAFRNLLNDGVIRRDLLISGIAHKIVESSFDDLKGDFQERLQKVKAFKGYQHPAAPFLSAKSVWEKVSPQLNRSWSALANQEGVNLESFERLAEAYECQRSVPSSWLKNFLISQERQYGWIEKDLSLLSSDLSLFGFKSLRDWFGDAFLSKASLFILNGAALAEEHGIHVSRSEAKKDLRRLFAESVESYKRANISIETAYQDQLRQLGLEEYEATALWQKILTFRRWMQRVGSSVLVDRLSAKESSAISGQEALVDLYRFNPEFSCKNAKDALGLFLYWKALFPRSVADFHQLNLVAVPEPCDIVKIAPELVAIRYRANVSAVDKREVGLLAPMKEVLEYELSDAGWTLAQKKFAFLKNAGGKEFAQRLAAIEKLDPQQRLKLDLFARRKLVDLHPEWIETALKSAPSKTEELSLSNGEIRLNHIENPKQLAILFQTILQKPEEALEALQKFESGEAVFRFESIEKCTDEIVKTFEEAKRDGTIDAIVSKALGNEKEAESQAKLLLEPWAKSIYKEDRWGVKKLYPLANAAKEALKKGGAPDFVASSSDHPLIAQFKLQKMEERVKRSGKEDGLTADKPFSMQAGDWSDLHVAEDGSVAFFYLKERIFQEPPLQNLVLDAQEILGIDAKHALAEYILAKIVERQATL